MKYIKLTQGKRAIIDDKDLDAISKYKWHFSNGYAKRSALVNGKKKILRMHHMIISFHESLMIDHINMNGLDNRRSNLRLVTKSQNMMNSGTRTNSTSGYKGVSWHIYAKKWRAYIVKNYKQINLGLFDKKLDAINAYNEGAKMYHGEYAKLNIIK